MAVDSLDRIIVTETGTGYIHIFYPNGTPAFKFGGSGKGFGEFDNMSRVTVGTNDRIFVSDPGNYRVQIFDPNGSFEGIIDTPGHPPKAGFYIVNDTGHRISLFLS